MFSIVITERGGAQRQLELDALEISIGRIEDNEVVLPRSNVSKRHARLVLKDDRYVLIDLKSTNGTYINGRRLGAPMLVGVGDKIYIGDFILSLQEPSRPSSLDRRLRDQPRHQSTQPLRPLSDSPTGDSSIVTDGGPAPALRGGAGSAHAPTLSMSAGPAVSTLAAIEAARSTVGTPTSMTAPSAAMTVPPTAISAGPPAMSAAPPATSSPIPASSPFPPNPPIPASAVISPGPTPPAILPPRRAGPPPPPPAVHPPAVPPPHRVPTRPYEPEGQTVEQPRVSGVPAPRMSSSPPPRVQDHESAQGAATSPAVLAPSIRLQGALQTLMERLTTRMEVFDPHERALPSEQQRMLESLLDELSSEGVIGPDLDRRFLLQAAVSETVGLGPLDRVLNNRSVRELVVEGPSRILADLGGGLAPVSSFFSSPRAVQAVLQRLFARGGRLLGPGPVEEVQLPDGSQVQVLMPPLSLGGPLLSIRCPVRAPTSPDSLVTEGTLSIDMLSTLRSAMHRRVNVLVVGPTGAGVSTLVSALASLCQDHERIVALQESPSLAIRHPNVLPLSLPGAGDRKLGQVLRHAAKLRGDRIVIDDVRLDDALTVLTTAAASRGLLAGMHASSPGGALEQLELFAQLATSGSRASLAALIAQAFSLLVHIAPDGAGNRKVQSISEIRGAQGNALEVALLYKYDGAFKAEGRPTF